MTQEQTLTLSEEEILVRAREALIMSEKLSGPDCKEICAGEWDDVSGISIAMRALRDLAKPISAIRPVDPDEAEAQHIINRFMAGKNGSFSFSAVALAAIKRGRELQKEAGR